MLLAVQEAWGRMRGIARRSAGVAVSRFAIAEWWPRHSSFDKKYTRDAGSLGGWQRWR